MLSNAAGLEACSVSAACNRSTINGKFDAVVLDPLGRALQRRLRQRILVLFCPFVGDEVTAKKKGESYGAERERDPQRSHEIAGIASLVMGFAKH